MILLGCLVNFATIFIMAIIGSLIKKGIPERIGKGITYAVALVVVYIGLDGLFLGKNIISPLVIIVSVAVGALLGELVNIDKGMNAFGAFVQKKLSKKNTQNDNFGKGFTTTTLLFCIGAMCITGAIQGAQGKHSIFYTKAVLDGVNALIIASTLGIGCAISAFTTFGYQALLTLLFYFILNSVDQSSIMFNQIINHVGVAGSLIIVAIGLNMLEITKIKTANLIPVMFMPIALCPLFSLIGI